MNSKEYNRAYYEAHRVDLIIKNRAYSREYYKAHRETIRSKRRADSPSISYVKKLAPPGTNDDGLELWRKQLLLKRKVKKLREVLDGHSGQGG